MKKIVPFLEHFLMLSFPIELLINLQIISNLTDRLQLNGERYISEMFTGSSQDKSRGTSRVKFSDPLSIENISNLKQAVSSTRNFTAK